MAQKVFQGEEIAPGVAAGILCFISVEMEPSLLGDKRLSQDIGQEIDRLEREVESVIEDLTEAVNLLRIQTYTQEAEIVETHIYMLKDEEFRKRVHEKITLHGFAAERALEHVLQEMVNVFESSENLLLSERTTDIKDIVMRLKRKLANKDKALFETALKGTTSPVVALKELFPSHIIEAKELGVAAFIVNVGTALSHAAILAKSFGIPVLKVNSLIGVTEGEYVTLDTINGSLYIQPDIDEIKIKEDVSSVKSKFNLEHIPVHLWVNIVDPQQLDANTMDQVEGVGLYRTEYLFMKNGRTFPTEDEQFEEYSALFEKYEKTPITVRTLDIGGDKTLPYFSFGPQLNPYLGLRAHRIYKFHPELFKYQIRALLRAAVHANQLRILYPMIESVDELLFIKGLLQETLESLRADRIPHLREFQQGVLIEVPSAAWDFKELLMHVDFASIGTNDLLQYFFALDRNNANVYRSYHPENPAALRMLKKLVDTAKDMQKPLSICGEISSDIRYLPLLIGLGFENLSIDYHAVYKVQECLSGLDPTLCKDLAHTCLTATNTTETQEIIDTYHSLSQSDTQSFDVDDESIDPICKMVVHTEGNKLMIKDQERTHYFCSAACRDAFLHKNETGFYDRCPYF